MERVQRMTPEEADKWYVDLMKHIAVQHPHLKDREAQWKLWSESNGR